MKASVVALTVILLFGFAPTVTRAQMFFAMKFGGGVDVGVARHFAVRLGEFNYYMTRFGTSDCLLGPGEPCGINGKGTQNNFTISTGIVIR